MIESPYSAIMAGARGIAERAIQAGYTGDIQTMMEEFGNFRYFLNMLACKRNEKK
jgi:hypothetical protein